MLAVDVAQGADGAAARAGGPPPESEAEPDELDDGDAAAMREYTSNTALYNDRNLREGRDYALRYRRHEAVGAGVGKRLLFPDTAVLAPHGGGIERGTSELCLAIAGYHPATGATGGGPVFDYWMFEGLLSDGNKRLHVTSTHCDDPVAQSLAGGSRHALSLHGCTAEQARAKGDGQAVVVGGRDGALKAKVMKALKDAKFQVIDGEVVSRLAGQLPANIVNRTLTGGGVQLETTTQLRDAMFKPKCNTAALRGRNTTAVFDRFVAAVRTALAAPHTLPAAP